MVFMTQRFTILIVFFLLQIAAFAEQYENLIIERIEISGFVPEGSYFDPEAIKSHIKTKEGDFFSQTTFDNDLKVLANEFDRVEPDFEIINKKLQVTLKVWPKPMIRSITFEGNSGVATPDLQSELGLVICTVYDRLEFNKAFHKLKAYYIKQGYFEAELSYTTVPDKLTNEVDITISIVEGRSGSISRIYFHNFTRDEEDEILDLMVTKKYNVFLSWLSGEGVYNEEMIQYDQMQIINYLQNEGYADANVSIEALDSPHFFKRIHLHITASRGECYTVGAITVEGNCLFTDEEICKCFTFEEGDLFSPEKIQQTTKRIEYLYGSKGYIDAAINFEPKLEIDCGNVYSVHLMIEEGEPFQVGMIKVFGNCTTDTNVILHETLLTPGETFNSVKLDLTEKRLQNIGYFENVNVYAVRTDEGSCLGKNFRDVHIEVSEQQTGRFGTFFGYSSVESLFGGINITEKNFNSAGLGSIFSKCGPGLRGGGEYLSTTVQVGQKSRSYGLSWTKPYFMDSKWSVGFDISRSSNRYISDDYGINATNFNLRATYEINAFLRAGWHYRISNTDVNISKSSFSDIQLFKASRIDGLISATGFNIGYDSTDSIENPTRGFRSMFEFEYAGLGGDHTFFSTAYLNNYYVPVSTRGTLKFRADFRFIQPLWKTTFNHIPLDERLYLGGDNIMRGYRAYRLGPLFHQSKDPKGGLSMIVGTIQYDHQLFKRMTGFLFYDIGSLTKIQWECGPYYQSAGFGARVKVLDSYPPVTFGLGFPFWTKKRNQRKIFFINFGGSF